MTKEQHEQWCRDLAELRQLQAENKRLKVDCEKKVKWILLQVGDVDCEGDYWGHDTNLGNIDEFVAEIVEALKGKEDEL